MWFTVDKAGLAKLVARRGPSFILAEIIQNAWDAPGTTKVDVQLRPVAGRSLVEMGVTDDSPAGFHDLSHAFTLFAESAKKNDPTLRGRFNLGEKLVLALCQSASIASTTGTVAFSEQGREIHPRRRRDTGTEFCATLRMTRHEMDDAISAALRFIAPTGIATTINGDAIEPRALKASFRASLPTEIADAEGVLRRSNRLSEVRLYQRLLGRPGWLYELGIPVVETGDEFDIDVQQKIPLAFERDSAPPAYLRQLRAATLNAAATLIGPEIADAGWIDDALESPLAKPEAVATIIRARFGDKTVAYDPSDREANDRAVAAGYKVLHGGVFSRAAWMSVRASGAVKPAGQVTPTPKPFAPDGAPAKPVTPTPAMNAFARMCRSLAQQLMGVDIAVEFLERFNAQAAYGGRRLLFNVGQLGKAWFEGPLPSAEQLALVLHEFAHEYESNHLSEGFADAIGKLGAKMALLAREDPDVLDLRAYS